MPSRRAFAPLAAAAVVAAALVPAVSGSAVAAPPAPQVTLTPLGPDSTGAYDEGASEIVAHDPERQRLFVVNAQAGTVDVLDIRDPRTPVKLLLARCIRCQQRCGAGEPGRRRAAGRHQDRPGFGSASSTPRRSRSFSSVPAGALPDMVTFTPSGDFALVANEGEPEGYCAGQVDPEGSVSIIDLRQGAEKATARTAGFTAYNSRVDSLRAQGVRIYGPGASVAQDLEPSPSRRRPTDRPRGSRCRKPTGSRPSTCAVLR